MQPFPNLGAIGFSYTEVHGDTETSTATDSTWTMPFTDLFTRKKKNTGKEFGLETLYYAYIPGLRCTCWLEDLGIME